MNNLNDFLTTGAMPATYRERTALLDSARAKILSLNTIMQLFPTPNGEPMNAAEFFSKATEFEKLRGNTPIFEAAKKAVATASIHKPAPPPASPQAATTGLITAAAFTAANQKPAMLRSEFEKLSHANRSAYMKSGGTLAADPKPANLKQSH